MRVFGRAVGGGGWRAFALGDDRGDRCQRAVDVLDDRGARHLAARVAGEDVACLVQSGDFVADRGVELADRLEARRNGFERHRLHRNVDRVFGLLDLHERILDRRLRITLDPDHQPVCAADPHRQRAGIVRDETGRVDDRRAADRVEDVAGELHVQHLLDDDAVQDLPRRRPACAGPAQRIVGGQIRRDRRMLELDRLLQRGLQAREVGDLDRLDFQHDRSPTSRRV